MSAETGGRAFPIPAIGEQCAPSFGLTIRDYFAGKVMQSIYVRLGGSPSAGNNHDGALDYVAEGAYAMADAMLRERAK